MEYQDSKEVSRGACDACGSSDANITYSDGHTYCFSCSAYTKGDIDNMQQSTRPAPVQGVYSNHFTDGQITAIPDRKLSQQTCQFFGVKTVTQGNDVVKHIYP